MTTEQLIKDRQDAILAARQLMDSPIVLFDTETTGLDNKAEIVEISCVSSDGTVLFDTLVRPTCSVPDEARAIHGISDNDLVGAPTLVELLPNINSAFAGQFVGSYNLEYDMRLLRQSLTARGYPTPADWESEPGGLFCVMELYAKYWGAWHDYFRSFTWQNLGNALKQCGLNVEGPLHRALSDTQAALAILRNMAFFPLNRVLHVSRFLSRFRRYEPATAPLRSFHAC